MHVDVHPAERVDGATPRARGLGCRHLEREDLAQHTTDRVAVDLALVHLFHPPVAPKRSVLIALASWPMPTRSVATASTNAVGPHTNTAGESVAGHATSRIIASSTRRV